MYLYVRIYQFAYILHCFCVNVLLFSSLRIMFFGYLCVVYKI